MATVREQMMRDMVVKGYSEHTHGSPSTYKHWETISTT